MGSCAEHLWTAWIEQVCDDSFLLAVQNNNDSAAAFSDAFRHRHGRAEINNVWVTEIVRQRQILDNSRTTCKDKGSVA